MLVFLGGDSFVLAYTCDTIGLARGGRRAFREVVVALQSEVLFEVGLAEDGAVEGGVHPKAVV